MGVKKKTHFGFRNAVYSTAKIPDIARSPKMRRYLGADVFYIFAYSSVELSVLFKIIVVFKRKLASRLRKVFISV